MTSAPTPDYKDTVNLPQTNFSMRANAIEKEPQIQQFWAEQNIYADLSANNPGQKFILHDGPPYANGSLHMGHALNKILKDIINRYQIMRGRKVRYVLGWDCHGLPIELKVIQNLKPEERKALSPLELRHKARDFALSAIAEQATGFKRWGVWGDYEHAYFTLKPEYEAAQIGVFGKMALNGYIYRGLRPVYWSPSSQTALAEAELEYPEEHVSKSIYVAFPVVTLAERLKKLLEELLDELSNFISHGYGVPENDIAIRLQLWLVVWLESNNIRLDLKDIKNVKDIERIIENLTKIKNCLDFYAVIWTTTPWTIPANLGISVNPSLSYSIVSTGDKHYIVATDLVEKLTATFGQELSIQLSFSGEVLEHTIAKHPIFDRKSPILLGEHVTAESGTGLVHTAPGHGKDDFIVGNKYGLGVLAPANMTFQVSRLGASLENFLNGSSLCSESYDSKSRGYELIDSKEKAFKLYHLDEKVYVNPDITRNDFEKLKNCLDFFAMIWTTMPWTIPTNLGSSVNPNLSYSIVAAGDKYYVVDADLKEKLAATFDQELFRVPAEFLQDTIIENKYHSGVLSPVNDYGIFTEEAGQFAGLNVLKEGNTAVINVLTANGSLLKLEDYKHKYPYDWRTKKPVIVRATEQWFASVDGFREVALQSIKDVNWIPVSGENRITSMVQERSDWCISRQRNWGVPIPVFYDMDTSEPLLTPETIAHIQEIFRVKGSDAWWELSIEELLPEQYRHSGKNYRKGTDTMDVWFDSGSSWAAVLNQREELQYPADLYLEGSDQHRGWFQSSLLTSSATNGHAPYKMVLTHGFTVDENGRKMSKSLGNGVDPMVIINGGKNIKQEPAYGADVLRLWVASVDYSADVPISKNILKQISDVSFKIRNTARFLLSNLFDFNPAEHAIAYADLQESDRYLLHRLYTVTQEITDAYDSFQFSRFFQLIQNFCVVDLSNFYLDIAKDRLYISAPNSRRRRSCQTVLAITVEAIAQLIAPVSSHSAEDIWQHLPYPVSSKSVFQAGWLKSDPQWQNPELASKWDVLRDVRSEVNKVLEVARNAKAIGSSLDAKVLLQVLDPNLKEQLVSLGSDLTYLFITSQTELVAELPEGLTYTGKTDSLQIGVINADGEKCPRCWNYSTHIGESTEHPHLCDRCVDALAGVF